MEFDPTFLYNIDPNVLHGVAVAIGGLIFFILVAHSIMAKDRKIKEGEIQERNRLKQAEYESTQRAILTQLVELASSTNKELLFLPDAIAAASRELDKAEAEFVQGVFSPFWDAVEKSISFLVRYQSGVQQIRDNATRFVDTANALSEGPPTFVSDPVIPDATAVVARMHGIVRKAQKLPDFAKIYEMRRTNSILVAGFSNLATAIEEVGWRIERSQLELHQALTLQLDSQQAHQVKVETMLDNIQHRRKP